MDNLRMASVEDRMNIKAVAEQAYAEYIPRMGMRPGPMDDNYGARISNGEAWIARDGPGALVALLVLEDRPRFLLVDNMAAAAQASGSGLGRQLLALCRGGGAPARFYGNAPLHTRHDDPEPRHLRTSRLGAIRRGCRVRFPSRLFSKDRRYGRREP